MLPIIIVLENHHHVEAKLALGQILNTAKQVGYQNIAIELPDRYSQIDILDGYKNELKESLELLKSILPYSLRKGVTEEKMYAMKISELSEFFRLYVSSKKHIEYAMIIKGLPARKQQNTLLGFLASDNFNLIAVDLSDSPVYVSLLESGLAGRARETEKSEHVRDQHIARNVVGIHQNKGNVVLQVGAFHFAGIFDFLKHNGLIENTIFVYPESKKCLGDVADLSLPKQIVDQCPHLVTAVVDDQEELDLLIKAFKVKLDSLVSPTYDEEIITTLVEKLKRLNPGFTGCYIKELHQVDGILPISNIDVIAETEKLKSLEITPCFISAKLPSNKEKCDILCVRDINGSSNSEKVNKI